MICTLESFPLEAVERTGGYMRDRHVTRQQVLSEVTAVRIEWNPGF